MASPDSFLVQALTALAGGVLIGCASAGIVLVQRRVAGISGILGGITAFFTGDMTWRFAFLGGLVLCGAVLAPLQPSWFAAEHMPPAAVLLLAGLLVGVGTQLANGCTSGHGVCGIGRFSKRSLTATATFTATGAITVFILRHLIGGLG